MKYLLLGYPKCSTCKKAIKFLDGKNIEYDFRDIVNNNPSSHELKKWINIYNHSINKYFNYSGNLYKSMNLKDKLPTMSDDEKISLLATNGMLVKRPLLIGDDFILIGFKIDEWNKYVK